MRYITFRRLEAVSFGHSAVYLALLLCAFVLGNTEPETFLLGLGHGLLWIGMSLVCIAGVFHHHTMEFGACVRRCGCGSYLWVSGHLCRGRGAR